MPALSEIDLDSLLGHGIVLAATWLLPVTLIYGSCDEHPLST
jgi:hypothetical protein